ncbi:hypothetical protein D3C72_2513570 [compost metagenome]
MYPEGSKSVICTPLLSCSPLLVTAISKVTSESTSGIVLFTVLVKDKSEDWAVGVVVAVA